MDHTRDGCKCSRTESKRTANIRCSGYDDATWGRGAMCLLRGLISTSILLVVGACASTEFGREFDEKRVAEIKSGVTTKAEVQSMLGQPLSRMRIDGKESWTYQRGSASAGVTGAGAAKSGAAT